MVCVLHKHFKSQRRAMKLYVFEVLLCRKLICLHSLRSVNSLTPKAHGFTFKLYFSNLFQYFEPLVKLPQVNGFVEWYSMLINLMA